MRYLLALCFLLPFFSLYAAKKSPIMAIVPNCLLQQPFAYKLYAHNEIASLIAVERINQLQHYDQHLRPNCRGFINVTAACHARHDNKAVLAAFTPKKHPSDFTKIYALSKEDTVQTLLPQVSLPAIKQSLRALTAFPDRSVDSANGVAAATWIKEQLLAMKKDSLRNDIDIFLVPTMDHMPQPSVIMRLGPATHEGAIVLGAHLDTIQKAFLPQKGADDDASGSVSLLAAAKVLSQSDINFSHPLYFIWYAGEEAGKLGSQSVVAYFNQEKITVSAALQLDMTGYVGDDKAGIGIADDYTDTLLSAFVADLVTKYLQIPVGASRCGFACSDHVIWYQQGVRVAYPFETMADTINPYIHSSEDRMNKLSLTSIANFAKLSIAFAVELDESA